ncbi:sulfotransferase family protein [Gemmobacter denitrificans]|uniref:Sulfotransferase n=1 Tax=Gemmobacter denitrificans TaxID=3123040 RepID=A0ABU8C0N4_9RHOB
MHQYHFITGLPRSGSTLLGGILRQNPRFHAGMTSPVGALVQAAIRTASGQEVSVMMTEDKCARLVRGIFDAYYDDAGAADVIFDTNRQWSANLPLLAQVMPQARVIACVRNPAWVVDSVEQIVRANPLRLSRIFGDGERATVFSRVEAIMRPDRLVGFALQALKEAYFGAEAGRMLLVEYDILCQRPRETLQLIYQFIGEPWFEHDFEAVDYDAEEFDTRMNTPGLHRVKRRVEWTPRDTILPPDVFQNLAELAFWRAAHKTRAHRITQSQEPPAQA